MPKKQASVVIDRIHAGEPVEALVDDIKSKRISSLHKSADPSDYEELYHLLQSLPEEESEHVFQMARSGSTVSAVLRQLQEADLILQLAVRPETRRTYEFPYKKTWPDLLRNMDHLYLGPRFHAPPQASTASLSDNVIYDVPYGGTTLVEPGLTDVKISRWTCVAADESMLTELLSLYFHHGYPFFHFFHKDLFLADLKTGRKQHCSSLLVNALLAAASHYPSTMPGRNEPWNTQSYSYRFFAETRRLWELEMGKNELTTLQAALVMNVVYSMDGLDEVGFVYMGQAAQLARNLKLFEALEGGIRTDMDVARLYTAWSLFSWQA